MQFIFFCNLFRATSTTELSDFLSKMSQGGELNLNLLCREAVWVTLGQSVSFCLTYNVVLRTKGEKERLCRRVI